MNVENENKVIDYKSFKWLISSSLQKALRRGKYDLAKPYIDFLWEHDRSYLTYRLGTILTEDVGFINLPLLNRYLSTRLEKLKIDKEGGVDFIHAIVKEACESTKDRSSCDAAYLASYFSLSNNVERELSLLKEREDKIYYLREVIKNKNLSYIDRINAGWIILGNNKFKNANLPFFSEYLKNEKEKDIDDLESFLNSFDFPNDVIEIMRNAYDTQREQIVLGLPIIQLLYHENLERINTENISAKIKIGDSIEKVYFPEESYYQKTLGFNILNSAIDGHTREGKSVYYKYLKMNNKFTHYMNKLGIKDELRMVILSHCLFRVEGHEVNKRVYFPSAVSIMSDCSQKILNMKMGLLPELTNEENGVVSFQKIKAILFDEISIINKLREQQILKMEVPYVIKKEKVIKKKI